MGKGNNARALSVMMHERVNEMTEHEISTWKTTRQSLPSHSLPACGSTLAGCLKVAFGTLALSSFSCYEISS